MGNLRSRCLGAIAEIPLEVPDRAIGIAGAFGIQADRLAETGPSGNRDHRSGSRIDRHRRHVAWVLLLGRPASSVTVSLTV